MEPPNNALPQTQCGEKLGKHMLEVEIYKSFEQQKRRAKKAGRNVRSEGDAQNRRGEQAKGAQSETQDAQSTENFSLEVAFSAADETLGFLGESGCGKSLTMRCIAGIEQPDSGKIVVNDTVFFDCAPGKRPKVNLTPQQRKTALLFQNYMLFPNLTVEDNVGAGISKDVAKAERSTIIERELKRFGLTGFNGRYPAQLSGGQQQRVALARMLAAKPEILMLDEPFSALDAHLKGVLEQNLVSLFDAFEGTILYVSHDIDEALRFCDRIAVVDRGRIMEVSSGDELVHNPQSLAAVKLSGCKNSPEVLATGAHEVFVPDWGVHLQVEAPVPSDVRAIGTRGFYIEEVAAPAGGNIRSNVFRVRVDRVSDSRFERTALLQFLDREKPHSGCKGGKGAHSANCECDEFEYINKHLYWRCGKLKTSPEDLPKEGDTLWIRIDPARIYVVNK